jgi:hypothetical protein
MVAIVAIAIEAIGKTLLEYVWSVMRGRPREETGSATRIMELLKECSWVIMMTMVADGRSIERL